MDSPQNSETLRVDTATLGEIARLVDDLNMITMTIQDTSNTLTERLRPVMRNEPSPPKEATKEYDPSTDMGQFLATLIMRVRATNSVLQDARNRLEL